MSSIHIDLRHDGIAPQSVSSVSSAEVHALEYVRRVSVHRPARARVVRDYRPAVSLMFGLTACIVEGVIFKRGQLDPGFLRHARELPLLAYLFFGQTPVACIIGVAIALLMILAVLKALCWIVGTAFLAVSFGVRSHRIHPGLAWTGCLLGSAAILVLINAVVTTIASSK